MTQARWVPSAGSVLIASGFPGRAGSMAQAFARQGLVPTLAFHATEVADLVDQTRFDLLAIDGDLPGGDSVALVRELTPRTDAVVILVGGPQPAADALAAGAHTRLGGGLSADEVAVHGRALVRLRGRAAEATDLEWGPLRLDGRRREAYWFGCPIEMTRLQFRILTALVAARGGVVTREELYRHVWHQAAPDDGERIVAHVRRIRAKLEPDPSRPVFLLTTRGEGFRLADPSELPTSRAVERPDGLARPAS